MVGQGTVGRFPACGESVENGANEGCFDGEALWQPSIFTAVQEQLGLKLVPHKEKFDAVVVDEIKLPDAD